MNNIDRYKIKNKKVYTWVKIDILHVENHFVIVCLTSDVVVFLGAGILTSTRKLPGNLPLTGIV